MATPKPKLSARVIGMSGGNSKKTNPNDSPQNNSTTIESFPIQTHTPTEIILQQPPNSLSIEKNSMNIPPTLNPNNHINMHWSLVKTIGAQPQGIWKHCTVAIGSKFYVFGVYGKKGRKRDPLALQNNIQNISNSPVSYETNSQFSSFPHDKILIFDTDTLCWKTKSHSGDIPDKPLYAHTASCIDDKIYIFGGGEGSNYYQTLWILDTQTMVWTKASPSGQQPAPRRAHSAIVIENSLYIFGGGSGNTALNDLFKLDVEKLHWTQIQAVGDFPKARGYHTTTVYQKKNILLLGGSGSSEIFKDIYVFETETKRWSRHSLEATFPRCAHSTTVVGHLMFVFGGNTGTELTNELSILNMDTMEWKVVTQTGAIPSKRSHHTMTFADNRLILFGGFDGRSYLSDLHYLDLGTYGYLTSKR